METNGVKGLRGFLIDAPERGKLRAIRDGAVLIEDGLIAAAGPFEEIRRAPGAGDLRWMHSPEAVIFPGLIDLHAHLPQATVVARAAESHGAWLERYALPMEKQFNAAAAKEQAPLFFESLARNGTTCAVLHAGVLEESCDRAFEAAEVRGSRAIIGKLMMDAADFDSLASERGAAQSIEQSERLCRKWHGSSSGRLEYAFSPFSAFTCTADLLKGAAELARKFGTYLQCHLSENPDRVEAARAKSPRKDGDTVVCANAGMLWDRAVMSQCVHVNDAEIDLLARENVAVAHCPTSNLFLGNGIMPLGRMLDAGLRIGLGSDVAGGPELNLWQVMRSAIEVQKARSFSISGVHVPGAAEVFHLATLGGAAALGKESIIGTLDIGKEADLVVMDLVPSLPYGSRGNVHAGLSAEEIVTLLIYRGGPHSVVETFVRGRSIHRAPEPLLL